MIIWLLEMLKAEHGETRDQKGAVVMEAESSSMGKGAGAMSRSRKQGERVEEREPHRVMAPKATVFSPTAESRTMSRWAIGASTMKTQVW